MTPVLKFSIKCLDLGKISRQTMTYILFILSFGFIGLSSIQAQTTKLVLNGVTISTGLTLDWSETTLVLSASSTIALGPVSHTVTFAASNNEVWTGTLLTINGWTGTAGLSGTTGRLFVGNDTSGLTSEQLSKINFTGYTDGAMSLSTGEIVPLTAGPLSSVISNGTGSSNICESGMANIKVIISGGVSPYSVTYTDGSSNFTVNNYISGADILVSPLTTKTYTIVSVVDANIVSGINNSGSATVTVNTPSIPTITGTYSASFNHADGLTHDYIDTSCILIATISDVAGGNVLGSTTVSTELLSTIPVPNVDGYQYGRRKYSINANSTGPASVTFYFTQADFDNYNANNAGFLDLPTSGDNNDPNKVYFRLVRVVNGAYVISGSLGNFLTWNATESRWELLWNIADLNADYYFTTLPSCEGIVVNNLMATNIQATSVTATWDNVVTTPAWGWYSIQYRTTSPEGAWINAGTVNNGVTSRIIGGLNGGTSYEMQIRRHCSSQSTGPWSSSVTFTTPTSGCTSPPNIVATTINANNITITWPSVSEASWFEFRYRVNSPVGNWVSGGTAGGASTTWTISNLSASTTYDIEARTFCSNGQPSAWGRIVATTTALSGCALPPDISATTIRTNSITVTWPNVSGASWFEFRYRVNTPVGNWVSGGTVGGAAVSKTINGLSAGTPYDIEARTFCSNGQPSAWGRITATTLVPSGCALPPNIVATTINAKNITVTWSSVPDAGWYEFRYRVNNPLGNWLSGGTLGGAAVSKTFSGLLSGTPYDIEARTFCSNGQPSAWGRITATTSSSSGCELPPDINSVSVTYNSATFTWTEVVGAAWFEFRYRIIGAQSWTSAGTSGGGATLKVISGLQYATNYEFQARTFCSNGQPSSWSTSTFFTTSFVSCSLPPSNLTVDAITNNSVTVSWDTVPSAASYWVRYKLVSAMNWDSVMTDNVNVILSGLAADSTYESQVKTICNSTYPGISSGYGNVVTFTTVGSLLSSLPKLALSDISGTELSADYIDIFALLVYPNPTSDILNLKFDGTQARETKVSIMDVSGRITKEMMFTTVEGHNNVQISLGDLAHGMYMIQVFASNKRIYTGRVIKIE